MNKIDNILNSTIYNDCLKIDKFNNLYILLENTICIYNEDLYDDIILLNIDFELFKNNNNVLY